MSRRANGEGSIYRRPDGRYEARGWVTTTTGKRKRVSAYGTSRAEAFARLAAIQQRERAGIPTPETAWRLDAYLDYWMETIVKPNRRLATYLRTRSVVELYLKSGLGSVKLDQLTVPMVQQFLNNFLAEGRTVSLVTMIRVKLSAALTQAQREELVLRNVARLATLPTYRPTREIHVWAPHETKAFLLTVSSDPLAVLFTLIAFYGLRRGEALGIRWSDVDFASNTISIRQQVLRLAGQLRQAPLKTAASRRDLPMLPAIRTLLLRHRQDAIAGAELVTTTSTGGPVDPRNVDRALRRLCAQADVRRIRLHELRHTTATLLKDLGVSPRDTQLILGHADVRTTLQIYQHDTPETRRTTLTKVEKVFWRDNVGRRWRQKRSSNAPVIALFPSMYSGGIGGARTPDFSNVKTTNATLHERLTEVNLLADERRWLWMLGAVAVKMVVKTDDYDTSAAA